MSVIDISIQKVNQLPELSANNETISTMWDNNAQTLRFDRAEDYAEKDMRVLLSRDGETWAQYDLGLANEMTLGGTFTQGRRLSLFVMFRDGDGYRLGTNTLSFQLRSAPQTGGTDYLQELVDRAPVDASISPDGAQQEFRNLAGDVTFTLPASPGGGGHTILDAEGNPVPQRAQLQFAGAEVSDTGDTTVITVPPGPKGEPGEDGTPGPAGPQGEPGPTIPSDWNQNDESALDHIKNRPFYTDPNVVLFEGVDLPFNETEPGAGVSAHVAESNLTFNEGQHYYVTWDGTEYNIVGLVFVEASGILVVGNRSLVMPSSPNTGEPFLFVSGAAGPDTLMIVSSDTAPTHTVSIVSNVVHKLDAKYLPITSIYGGEGDEPVVELPYTFMGQQVYRKVIRIPGILNAGLNGYIYVPHHLPWTATGKVLAVEGVAFSPDGFVSMLARNGLIQVTQTEVFVSVSTGGFTFPEGYVTITFTKT